MLKRGWQVRAVTRNPQSPKAQALVDLGAEVVQADMDDRHSLDRVFTGIQRVLSVQNWTTSSVEAEIQQGKQVAEAAKTADISHLVYASAGTGDPHTGVPHFDSKLEVEAYMRAIGLPFTILRPAPFMELLTEKEFFPPLAVWGAQIKILGWDASIPWVSVRDIGLAVANIFDNPETWIGQDIELFGDIKTMRQCQQVFKAVDGKKPLRISLPLGLFQKMAGEEFILMWRWLDKVLRNQDQQFLWQTLEKSREVNPDMLNMEAWLKIKRNGGLV
jgi:uncharacterized protein YbjT (DUF2867 family)